MKNILWVVVAFSSFLLADFIRDEDDIVTDTQRHLQWQDYKIKSNSWLNAITYCEESTLGGFEDWRLPNIHELISITNYSYEKNIIEKVFIDVSTYYYWSSTTVNNSTTDAWSIQFGTGNSFNAHKSKKFNVRCIRTVE